MVICISWTTIEYLFFHHGYQEIWEVEKQLQQQGIVISIDIEINNNVANSDLYPI